MKNRTITWMVLAVAAAIVVILLMPSLPLGRTKTRVQRVQGVNIVSKVSFTLTNTNALPRTTQDAVVLLKGAQVPPPKVVYTAPLLIQSNSTRNNALTNK